MDSLTRLGRYRLLCKLGQGGMAAVYLAETYGASGFEKRVALKTLVERLRDRGEYQRLLIEEARLGARLAHRGLVAVHDLGVDQGIYYVCMDYVDGADLHALVRRGRDPDDPDDPDDPGDPDDPDDPVADCPPLELALLIAEEVAHALEYVHRFADDRGRALGLVHRDVSPSNLLLSRAGEVKLADFGIAKATALAEDTLSNVRKGKYAYMSPEQVSGEPLTSVSDQFSLGVTLAELCAGARPFDGATVLETMENITAAAPPRLDGVADDVRAIILQCLSREPGERFASADALARALVAARRRRPAVTPTDLGAWVTARLPSDRRRPPG